MLNRTTQKLPRRAAAATATQTPPQRAPAPASKVLELIEVIRAGLPAGSRVRVLPQHAIVLATMRAMSERTPDAQAIYKALADAGEAFGMTKVYRTLSVLEEAGVVRRGWTPYQGRVRGIYSLAERGGDLADDGHGCCVLCGAALARAPKP